MSREIRRVSDARGRRTLPPAGPAERRIERGAGWSLAALPLLAALIRRRFRPPNRPSD